MKIKIQIKSWLNGSVLFEFEKENNTIRDTVIEAIKISADLRYADLRYANLSYADLRYADLRSADLRYADLRSANLSYAKTNKRYIQISCIGSAKRMTTYCFDDDIIWCGCFTGTLAEFKAIVKKEHANNAQYLAEYMGFIKYLNELKSI